MVDSKVFKWRIIEPWHVPDGTSWFSHHGNIFTWADMHDTQASSSLGRYVTQLSNWGFNGIALNLDPDKKPEEVCNFASYLKRNGIGMFIRREWCEIEYGNSWPPMETEGDPELRSSPKLSPYNEEVRAYWTDRIARDYEMIPDLAGYRMNGTEFYFINGAPWMGEGPIDKTKTGRERTRDAICLVGSLLAEHGGTLIWETCQDDGWGQRQETYYFRDLTGEIPANAIVLIKRFYWDFHPRWPKHPLFDIITKDNEGHSPYMTSIQSPGEYRGWHDFPWCMVDEWSDCFRDMVATGQSGVWVMAMIKPDEWDHPLNMVNWYAIEHYIKNPQADPAKLKHDWAKEQFGEEVASVVVSVVDKVTEAARGAYEFDAMWTANHSRLSHIEYLDSRCCGPMRQLKRMSGIMGLALPLDMYEPETAAKIRANPQTRMVFNQVPITPELKDEAMAQKNGATVLMDEAINLWMGIEGKIDKGKFQTILTGLEGNRNDTIIFAYGMDLYFDWKLGTLTEERIDEVLNACRGIQGIVVPEPLTENPPQVSIVEPASLKTFAEQLRRDLREPWIERFFQEGSPKIHKKKPIDWDD